jgi:chromosome segregation ATPase
MEGREGMNKTIRQYEADIISLKNRIDADQHTSQNSCAAINTCKQTIIENEKILVNLKKEKLKLTQDLDTKINNLKKQNRMLSCDINRYRKQVHQIGKDFEAYEQRIKYRERKIKELKDLVLQEVQKQMEKKEEQKDIDAPKYLNGLGELVVVD